MGKTLTERQLQAIEKWGQALLLDKNGGLLAGGALRARLAKLEKDKQEETLAQYEARRNQVLRIKGEVLAQMRSEFGGGEAMTFPHANRLADDFVGGRNQKLNDLTDNDEVEWLLRSAAGLDVDLHLAKLEASASGEVKGANKGTVEGVTEESVQEIIEETGYDPTVLHAAIEEMRGEVAKATVAMSAAGEQLNQKKAAKRAAKKAAEAAKEEKKVKFQNMMASVAGLEREFLIEVALHLGGNCKKAVLANVNSGTPIPEKTMKKIESLSQAEIAGLAIAAQQRRANDEDSKRRAEEEAKAKEAEAERIKNSSRANAQDENKAGEDAGEEEKVKNDSKKKGGEKKVAWYRRLIASVAAMFSRNPEKNAKSEKRAMRAWARIVRKEVKANLPEGKLCSGAGPVAEYIESLFGAIQALRQKWEAGPRTYLGLMTESFPNLFMIHGPQSPGVLYTMPLGGERHVNWIETCIRHLENEGLGTIEATEAPVRRVGYVRQTIFGAFWDFRAELSKADTAYTNLELLPHTDGTYSHDAPGLQLLHCLAFDGEGGESTMVDGFRIASELRAAAPDLYEVLSTVQVPGQFGR